MEPWNGSLFSTRRKPQLYLANRSRTLIRIKKGLKFHPGPLFEELERAGFPLRYMDGLDTVTFTVLTGDAKGYYIDNKVWIDVSKWGKDDLLATFVHEVGHFMDDEEELSGLLTSERLYRHHHLKDRNAKKDNAEYLATGFERFYSLDPKDRKHLREQNPRLYRVISALHKRYRAK